MRTIFAEYNPHRNSIDIYTSAGYMLRIDCWEAEKDLKTTPGSDCALNALAIDKPLEYAKLYLDGTMQIWVDAEHSLDGDFFNSTKVTFSQSHLLRIVFLPCIYIQYLFIYYNEIKGWSNASPTKMKIHIENKFTIFPI